MRLLTSILTTLIVLGSLPASASQPDASANALVPPAAAGRWTADKKNPYSRLFKSSRPQSTQAPQPEPSGATGKPEIKCGMTMIPVDPKGFPGIVLPPESRSTKFTIRAIDPALCK